MRHVPSLPTVRTIRKGVHTSVAARRVQRSDVRVHVEHPVRIWWIRLGRPLIWRWVHLQGQVRVLRLVVHRIEAYQLLQHVKHVGTWVLDVLEQRLEDVGQQVTEAADHAHFPKQTVQPRHLDQPTDVPRLNLVLPEPPSEPRPLAPVPSVDGDAPLGEDVSVRLVLGHQFLRQFGHVPSFNEVVSLQEDVPQTLVTKWIVLVVEPIEAAERVVLTTRSHGGHATQTIRCDRFFS
mmetsp:Transcript_1730/g.4666  ORF Transcript_1730/g.4666 Transcript_1730/m.4666 type:complete len:235 (-) Transcript_1730:1024-1728(-)